VTRARVLLVDDDASIRRFVALALDEIDIELVEADGVPQARRQFEPAGAAEFVKLRPQALSSLRCQVDLPLVHRF